MLYQNLLPAETDQINKTEAPKIFRDRLHLLYACRLSNRIYFQRLFSFSFFILLFLLNKKNWQPQSRAMPAGLRPPIDENIKNKSEKISGGESALRNPFPLFYNYNMPKKYRNKNRFLKKYRFFSAAAGVSAPFCCLLPLRNPGPDALRGLPSPPGFVMNPQRYIKKYTEHMKRKTKSMHKKNVYLKISKERTKRALKTAIRLQKKPKKYRLRSEAERPGSVRAPA